MNDGDTITQKTLNSLIRKVIDDVEFNYVLNLLETVSNPYCNLDVDLNGNIVSGDELIVNKPIKITLSNKFFSNTYNTLNYYLQINYYKLNPDINDNAENPLITYETKLEEGTNNIRLDYPAYVQTNYNLIIKV